MVNRQTFLSDYLFIHGPILRISISTECSLGLVARECMHNGWNFRGGGIWTELYSLGMHAMYALEKKSYLQLQLVNIILVFKRVDRHSFRINS